MNYKLLTRLSILLPVQFLTTAWTCPSDSIHIAADKLAYAIDKACGCEEGSVLLNAPPPMAVPVLKGVGRKYATDSPQVKEALDNLVAIEKSTECVTMERVER